MPSDMDLDKKRNDIETLKSALNFCLSSIKSKIKLNNVNIQTESQRYEKFKETIDNLKSNEGINELNILLTEYKNLIDNCLYIQNLQSQFKDIVNEVTIIGKESKDPQRNNQEIKAKLDNILQRYNRLIEAISAIENTQIRAMVQEIAVNTSLKIKEIGNLFK